MERPGFKKNQELPNTTQPQDKVNNFLKERENWIKDHVGCCLSKEKADFLFFILSTNEVVAERFKKDPEGTADDLVKFLSHVDVDAASPARTQEFFAANAHKFLELIPLLGDGSAKVFAWLSSEGFASHFAENFTAWKDFFAQLKETLGTETNSFISGVNGMFWPPRDPSSFAIKLFDKKEAILHALKVIKGKASEEERLALYTGLRASEEFFELFLKMPLKASEKMVELARKAGLEKMLLSEGNLSGILSLYAKLIEEGKEKCLLSILNEAGEEKDALIRLLNYKHFIDIFANDLENASVNMEKAIKLCRAKGVSLRKFCDFLLDFTNKTRSQPEPLFSGEGLLSDEKKISSLLGMLNLFENDSHTFLFANMLFREQLSQNPSLLLTTIQSLKETFKNDLEEFHACLYLFEANSAILEAFLSDPIKIQGSIKGIFDTFRASNPNSSLDGLVSALSDKRSMAILLSPYSHELIIKTGPCSSKAISAILKSDYLFDTFVSSPEKVIASFGEIATPRILASTSEDEQDIYIADKVFEVLGSNDDIARMALEEPKKVARAAEELIQSIPRNEIDIYINAIYSSNSKDFIDFINGEISLDELKSRIEKRMAEEKERAKEEGEAIEERENRFKEFLEDLRNLFLNKNERMDDYLKEE
ncbi:MAG: hypothetical protein QW035_00795 [Candidatus Anstonellales archaeon]